MGLGTEGSAGKTGPRVLIAEDEVTSRLMLERLLTRWGYDVIAVADGYEALGVLLEPDAPRLALLDWVMPGMEGLEVCRRVRDLTTKEPPYLIILTSRDAKEDVVAGLDAGANDYIGKPFDGGELRARLRVGERVVGLQAALALHARNLEQALAHIKTLQGILPICMHCHKIRNDQESWEKIEEYLAQHTDLQFTHSLCPECLERRYPEPSSGGGTGPD